jgi:hypothetical protein
MAEAIIEILGIAISFFFGLTTAGIAGSGTFSAGRYSTRVGMQQESIRSCAN